MTFAFFVILAALAMGNDDPTQLSCERVDAQLRYVGPAQRRSPTMGRCFQAQHYEDLYLFTHYFRGVTNGTFVEIGALDGYSYSVSFFFERFLNWRGLMIDASPKNYKQFLRRTMARRKSRRRSEFVLSAVCESEGNVTFVSKEGTGAGILEFMPQRQQERNLRMCRANVSATDIDAHDCALTSVPCRRLSTMLSARGIREVDVFVLDVEGAEFEVIKTFDFSSVRVRFWLVELDGTRPAKDCAVRRILLANNFFPVGRLDLNELWEGGGVDEKRYGPPAPPSVWAHCFVSPLPSASEEGAGGGDEALKGPILTRRLDGGASMEWSSILVVFAIPVVVFLARYARRRYR